jgi:hypothetical protein
MKRPVLFYEITFVSNSVLRISGTQNYKSRILLTSAEIIFSVI